jgi:hypothetical protein
MSSILCLCLKAGKQCSKTLLGVAPRCNLHKAARTDATAPETNQLAPLFHPRLDSWPMHFAWDGYQLNALSANGRATITALKLNSERRLLIRMAEEQLQLFPPN